jgi:hypothetical protein
LRAHFGALAEIGEHTTRAKLLTPEKVRDREGAIASTRGARAPQNYAARSERPINVRTKYKIDESASTIPVTRNSRTVA